MITHKVMYALSVLIMAVVFFMFPEPILFGILVLTAVLPIVAAIVLGKDVGKLDITASVPSACAEGETLAITISCKSSRPLLAASAAEVTLEMNDLLFSSKKLVRVRVPLLNGKSIKAEFVPELCGEYIISSASIICYDVFGICSVKSDSSFSCRVQVMPERPEINVNYSQVSKVRQEKGTFSVSRRGNDVTEVYALRDYVSGDEMKTVHWKLSSKTKKLIVKEYSDSTHFDTIVLFDIALSAKGTQINKKLLSAAVGAAAGLSKALGNAQCSHTAAFVFNGSLVSVPVESEISAEDFISLFIAHPLPETNGNACQFFLAKKLENEYENLVYFTVGSFPPELALIPENINLNAVLITDNEGQPSVSQHGKSKTLVEIPLRYLDETNSFDIAM